MLAVCRRYIKDAHFAEDVMIEGFVKVFQHLGSFRQEGSFEGWVRRIMVRQAIDFLRKREFIVFEDELQESEAGSEEPSDVLLLDQIERWVEELPDGCKTVFYLYVVEGYKHNEIAELLNISENTSKTQLHKARKALQQRIIRQKAQVL
jgi:RNA polymerase sigma-70 factor (ECF subfamily)